MIGFICLFLPAILAVYLYEIIQQTRLDKHSFWGLYCFDIIAINMICFAIKRFVLGTANEVMLSVYSDMTPSAAMNYLIMALPAVIVVTVICVFAKRNVNISKDVEDEEEKDNQRSC